MAVGLAKAAKAAGAYRSRIPQLIRTAGDHSIFHGSRVKLGTTSLLLCGGHTISDFHSSNRWHLPLNNDTGWTCANNDGLGAWKILQRREWGDAKEACLFITKEGKYEQLMGTSITPCHSCLEELWGRHWQGWIPSTWMSVGFTAWLVRRGEGVRFVTCKLASCHVHSDVERVLAHACLVRPWKCSSLIFRASVCQGLFFSFFFLLGCYCI